MLPLHRPSRFFSSMRPLPAVLDHAHRHRIKLQRAMAIPLRPLHPAHRIRIRGRLQFPAHHAAQVVRDHIMVADALALPMNAVQQLDQFHRFDRQPGLFPHLANYPRQQRFAQLPALRPAASIGPASARFRAAPAAPGPHPRSPRPRPPAALQETLAASSSYQTELLYDSALACLPRKLLDLGNTLLPLARTVCCGLSSNKHRRAKMSEFTLRIDGMHCGSCIRRVSQALASADGLQVEEVRLGAARLQHQSSPCTRRSCHCRTRQGGLLRTTGNLSGHARNGIAHPPGSGHDLRLLPASC